MTNWLDWKHHDGSRHDDLWKPQIRVVNDKKRMTWDIIYVENVEHRSPFECDHVLWLHNDNNYPSFQFAYSPTCNSCNVRWAMMNHIDVARRGPPWLANPTISSTVKKMLLTSTPSTLILIKNSRSILHVSTSTTSLVTAKILYLQQQNDYNILISSWEYASAPHHHHSSFMFPHKPSHGSPPKSCTYHNKMSIVYSSPHENVLHFQHQPSRWLPPKSDLHQLTIPICLNHLLYLNSCCLH